MLESRKGFEVFPQVRLILHDAIEPFGEAVDSNELGIIVNLSSKSVVGTNFASFAIFNLREVWLIFGSFAILTFGRRYNILMMTQCVWCPHRSWSTHHECGFCRCTGYPCCESVLKVTFFFCEVNLLIKINFVAPSIIYYSTRSRSSRSSRMRRSSSKEYPAMSLFRLPTSPSLIAVQIVHHILPADPQIISKYRSSNKPEVPLSRFVKHLIIQGRIDSRGSWSYSLANVLSFFELSSLIHNRSDTNLETDSSSLFPV